MRQLGNATDGNGNTGGLLDAAFDPGSRGLADSDIAAAAAEVNLPSVLSDPHPNSDLDNGAANDLPALHPSIADWLSTFRPFASSLVDETAGSHGASNASFLGQDEPTNDVDMSARSDGIPFVDNATSSSVEAPDMMSVAKSNQDSLQKLYAHLSELDGRPVDHGPAIETVSHAPISPANDPAPPASAATHPSIDTATGNAEVDFILVGSNSGAGGTTGGTGTTSTTTTGGGSASAGLVINVTYDASVASAPAGFKTDVAAAVQYFESHFSDPVTININVGYGEINGQTMGSGALGQSMYFVTSYNYSQVKNALVTDAKSASDMSAIATLPTSDPTNGGTFYVSSADAKALGLIAGSSTDGYVGFGSAANIFDYDNTNGVAAGQYDFMGTVMHEISEVLGRETMDGQSATYYPLDLYHYSSSGIRTFSGTTPGYFSVNNGQTNLNSFNTNPGGDFGDWAGNTIDAANAYGSTGVVAPFSAADLTAMDVIGWNLTSGGPVVTASLAVDTGASSTDKNTSNATITGTGNANAVVTITEGSTTLGTTTANASGVWTFSPGRGFANGTHTITASETDLSGTTGTASLTFTLDTVAPVAPTITSFSPDSGTVGDGITNASTLTLTGAAEANSTVKVYDATTLLGSATANSSGAWTFTTASLVNGAHSLTAAATDAAGNTGAASTARSVTVDTVAPAAPAITSDVIVNTNELAITGAAEANSTVKVYDGAALLGSASTNTSGVWSYTTAPISSGTHSLTATATDAAGNTSAASSASAATVSTGVTAVIEANGSTSLVEVGTKFFLDSSSTGSGPSLKYGGADVVAGQFGNWAPIGAEQTASGYEVAWKLTGADQYSVWTTDSSGNYISTTPGAMSGSSSTFESFETSFHQDLNGDGVIGVPGMVIEANGSTSLVEVGTKFFLDGISTGSGPSLKYGGADVVAGQFGNWAPIGVEQTAGGYEVAWKVTGADQYSVWTTDSNGNYISTTPGAMSGSSSTFESFETSFHQDLNGDGVIGVGGMVIEANGSTSLVEVGTKFFLDGISTGSGPSLKYGGADVVAGQFGNWAPIGVEQTAGGYEVAWKVTGADQYSVWTTDSSGNFISVGAVMSGSSSTFESFETSFHQDLNGDGVIGVPGTVIESSGSTSLVQVGTKFFLDSVSSISTGSGPSLKYAGADVVAGQFGNWTPIGVEHAASGFEVAWKVTGADQYSVWTTDSSGNFISVGAVMSGSSSALELFETSFHQDLNGDGVIGVPGMVIESSGSISLIQAGDHFVLEGTNGSAPSLKYAGADVVAGQFGNWAPIGAEQTANGYEVAWKVTGADQYSVWTTDSSGNFTSVASVMSGSSSALESFETSFHQDLNGDGVIGVPGTVIESSGSISLIQAGDHFVLEGTNGSAPSLKYAGADVVAGQFGNWAPIGAEQTANGYEVAWKVTGADQYSVWTADSNGNFVSTTAAMSGSSSTFESFETSFHQDLNGDGIIGVPGASTSAVTLSGTATALNSSVDQNISQGRTDASSLTSPLVSDTFKFVDLNPSTTPNPTSSPNLDAMGALTSSAPHDSSGFGLSGLFPSDHANDSLHATPMDSLSAATDHAGTTQNVFHWSHEFHIV